MENENQSVKLEQSAIEGKNAQISGESADTANQCADLSEQAASNFGKFKSAEDLLNAYNALSKEFTKRCQHLKDVKQQLDRREKEAQAVNLEDDEFISRNILPSEKINNLVISKYLQALSNLGSVQVLGARLGSTALSPIKRPKNLEEAKKLADIMIKS